MAITLESSLLVCPSLDRTLYWYGHHIRELSVGMSISLECSLSVCPSSKSAVCYYLNHIRVLSSDVYTIYLLSFGMPINLSDWLLVCVWITQAPLGILRYVSKVSGFIVGICPLVISVNCWYFRYSCVFIVGISFSYLCSLLVCPLFICVHRKYALIIPLR